MSTSQVSRPEAPPEQSRIACTLGADVWVGTGILAALVMARLMVHVL